MNEKDKKLLVSITNSINEFIEGKINIHRINDEKINIDEIESFEIRQLYETVEKFFEYFQDGHQFINHLSAGELDYYPPSKNQMIVPFKQLHSNLRHLIWQIKEVSKGDYNQEVSFLGDFSEGFNLMIKALKERDENLKSAKQEIEKINKELVEKNLMLLEINNRLGEKSIKDGLTSLYNYQYTIDSLQSEIRKARMHDESLSIIMADIDYFKRVNDTYGHQVGDIVLSSISKILKDNLRSHDVIGRVGGEEFLMILPQTDVKAAFSIAERIRINIENKKFENHSLNVTASFGVVEFCGEDSKAVISKVDSLLYKAKENGRNRIEK